MVLMTTFPATSCPGSNTGRLSLSRTMSSERILPPPPPPPPPPHPVGSPELLPLPDRADRLMCGSQGMLAEEGGALPGMRPGLKAGKEGRKKEKKLVFVASITFMPQNIMSHLTSPCGLRLLAMDPR